MQIATLGVVLNAEGQVLLGEKKRGEIGTGVLSGPGGKLAAGETLEACLLRETREELEIELDPASLEQVALIDFYAEGKPDFRVYVYRAKILRGELHETADMIPAWYPMTDETFARTYEGDRHWLPQAVRGEKFRAKVHYRERAKHFSHIEFLPFADTD